MALLTAKELAMELGVSLNTVMRAFHRGQIPGERIGRLIRFDLPRVRKVMRQRGRPEKADGAGAVRIGASRPRGAGTPPTSKTGALRAGPLRKPRPWTARRSS